MLRQQPSKDGFRYMQPLDKPENCGRVIASRRRAAPSPIEKSRIPKVGQNNDNPALPVVRQARWEVETDDRRPQRSSGGGVINHPRATRSR